MLVQFAQEPEYSDICDSVYSVIFFGAPNKGLNTTALEALVQGKPSERLIKDLSPDSSFLQNQNRTFSQISKGLKIVSCYELKETPTVKAKEFDPESWDRTGPSAMMVEPMSACMFSSNETEIPINENHSNIAKLDRSSTAYQRLKELMTKHIDSAPYAIDAKFSQKDTVEILVNIDSIGRHLIPGLYSIPLSTGIADNLNDVLNFLGQFKNFLEDDISATILLRESISTPFSRRILIAVSKVWDLLLPYQTVADRGRSSPWMEHNVVHRDWDQATNTTLEPRLDERRALNLHDVASRCASEVRILTTFAMLGIEDSTSLEAIGKSPSAQLLRIDKTALRQRLIRRTSEILDADFEPLEGFLEPQESATALAVASFSPDPSIEEQDVIVEYRPYGQDANIFHTESSMKRTLEEQEARDKAQLGRLASLLRKLTEDSDDTPSQNSDTESTPCVLRCLGFINQTESMPNRIAILFQPPPGIAIPAIKSLHSAINDNSILTALEYRFRLSWQLCSAMLRLHSWGWLHKGIRSENVLLVPSNNQLGFSLYLRGFEYARHKKDSSRLISDHELDREIYRHPDRQEDPSKPFTKNHDLYSIGVVLLEIGAWKPVRAILQPWMTACRKQDMQPESDDIARKIRKHAARYLPKSMGSRFADLVRRCLESDFEVSTPRAEEDPSGIALSMSFYDLMLQAIEPGCQI